jgi:hypothetical protein
MIYLLRALFILVLLSMVIVTSWAGMHTSLFDIPPDVRRHPWFIATLFDAYWGFVTFYVWVAWKEHSLVPRVLWFIAIIALGNIAMSLYLLRELFRAPAHEPLEAVFARRHHRGTVMPALLAAGGIVIYILA